jgi:hypothetical protein
VLERFTWARCAAGVVEQYRSVIAEHAEHTEHADRSSKRSPQGQQPC